MLHEIKIVPRFHKTVLHTWKKSWAAFYPNDFLPRERRSGGGTIPKGEAEGARTDGQGWVSSERGHGIKRRRERASFRFLRPSFFPRSLGGDAITSPGANCFTHATKGCVEKTAHVRVVGCLNKTWNKGILI